jgi:hypothetical protein
MLRNGDHMTATILATTFDCHVPLRVAQFWATALRYLIDDSNAPDSVQISDPAGTGRLCFEKDPKAKTVKNRVHLDLTSDLSWQAEVERLAAVGAPRKRRPSGAVACTIRRRTVSRTFAVMATRSVERPRGSGRDGALVWANRGHNVFLIACANLLA